MFENLSDRLGAVLKRLGCNRAPANAEEPFKNGPPECRYRTGTSEGERRSR